MAAQFAVATVLVVTTTLIAISIPFVKHLPYILGLAFFIFFGFLDGLFWGAALKKVPHGAWFPLGLGGLLYVSPHPTASSRSDKRDRTILMVFWTWGRELEDSFDDANTQRLSRLIVSSPDPDAHPHPARLQLPSSSKAEGKVELSDDGIELSAALNTLQSEPEPEDELDSDLYLRTSSGELLKLERIPVMAIFHRNDSAGKGVPHSFASFSQRYPALPQVVVSISSFNGTSY